MLKEKLYTIPVNDAFAADCECPVCAMYQVLEQNAVEYTMGPSYMEDDVRMETDKLGFCRPHMRMLLAQENKLGLALILKTHFAHTEKEMEKKMKLPVSAGGGFFKKTESSDPVCDYAKELNRSCFICSRIENTFARYLHTLVTMWKTDAAFRETYKGCKGFCTEHMKDLLTEGAKELPKNSYEEFRTVTMNLYMENMKRVEEDLEWFINKFDYRYQKEPWKNAKDSIPRAAVKTNSIYEPEEKKKKS